jgi:hypothetical protein
MMNNVPRENALSDIGIFLSYASEDRAKAEQFLAALRARGFPVFFDQEMPAGVEWDKVLESVLDTAYGVVVLWSSHSVKKAAEESAWIYREAAIGLKKDKLFPISIDPDVSVPKAFDHIQAADLSGWNGDPNDPKFDVAISLLRSLWIAQKGLLKDEKVLRLMFKTRPTQSNP